MKFVASVLNVHIAQPLPRPLSGARIADAGRDGSPNILPHWPTLTGDDDPLRVCEASRRRLPRRGVARRLFAAATNVDIVSPCFVEVLS